MRDNETQAGKKAPDSDSHNKPSKSKGRKTRPDHWQEEGASIKELTETVESSFMILRGFLERQKTKDLKSTYIIEAEVIPEAAPDEESEPEALPAPTTPPPNEPNEPTSHQAVQPEQAGITAVSQPEDEAATPPELVETIESEIALPEQMNTADASLGEDDLAAVLAEFESEALRQSQALSERDFAFKNPDLVEDDVTFEDTEFSDDAFAQGGKPSWQDRPEREDALTPEDEPDETDAPWSEVETEPQIIPETTDELAQPDLANSLPEPDPALPGADIFAVYRDWILSIEAEKPEATSAEFKLPGGDRQADTIDETNETIGEPEPTQAQHEAETVQEPETSYPFADNEEIATAPTVLAPADFDQSDALIIGDRFVLPLPPELSNAEEPLPDPISAESEPLVPDMADPELAEWVNRVQADTDPELDQPTAAINDIFTSDLFENAEIDVAEPTPDLFLQRSWLQGTDPAEPLPDSRVNVDEGDPIDDFSLPIDVEIPLPVSALDPDIDLPPTVAELANPEAESDKIDTTNYDPQIDFLAQRGWLVGIGLNEISTEKGSTVESASPASEPEYDDDSPALVADLLSRPATFAPVEVEAEADMAVETEAETNTALETQAQVERENTKIDLEPSSDSDDDDNEDPVENGIILLNKKEPEPLPDFLARRAWLFSSEAAEAPTAEPEIEMPTWPPAARQFNQPDDVESPPPAHAMTTENEAETVAETGTIDDEAAPKTPVELAPAPDLSFDPDLTMFNDPALDLALFEQGESEANNKLTDVENFDLATLFDGEATAEMAQSTDVEAVVTSDNEDEDHNGEEDHREKMEDGPAQFDITDQREWLSGINLAEVSAPAPLFEERTWLVELENEGESIQSQSNLMDTEFANWVTESLSDESPKAVDSVANKPEPEITASATPPDLADDPAMATWRDETQEDDDTLPATDSLADHPWLAFTAEDLADVDDLTPADNPVSNTPDWVKLFMAEADQLEELEELETGEENEETTDELHLEPNSLLEPDVFAWAEAAIAEPEAVDTPTIPFLDPIEKADLNELINLIDAEMKRAYAAEMPFPVIDPLISPLPAWDEEIHQATLDPPEQRIAPEIIEDVDLDEDDETTEANDLDDDSDLAEVTPTGNPETGEVPADDTLAAVEDDGEAPALIDTVPLESELILDEDLDLEQYLVFEIDEVAYAVPAVNVREVGELEKVTAVPNVPHWLVGVTNMRGDILSLVDLRAFFGLKPAAYTAENQMMVAHSDAGFSPITAGLIVDGVKDIEYLAPTSIETPDIAVNDQLAPYLQGVYQQNDRLRLILDFDLLLNSTKMRQFEP